MLATNRLVTILPGFSIVLLRPHPGLVALPVKLRVASDPVGIVTLKNRSLSPAAHMFIESMRGLTKPLARSECRWREALADIRQLDGLYGQVARSGRQTMGLFLSINGWSSHVVPLAKQNPSKSIILMEGFDLRTVLAHPFDLKHLLRAKLRALNLDAEPYFSISQLLLK